MIINRVKYGRSLKDLKRLILIQVTLFASTIISPATGCPEIICKRITIHIGETILFDSLKLST